LTERRKKQSEWDEKTGRHLTYGERRNQRGLSGATVLKFKPTKPRQVGKRRKKVGTIPITGSDPDEKGMGAQNLRAGCTRVHR